MTKELTRLLEAEAEIKKIHEKYADLWGNLCDIDAVRNQSQLYAGTDASVALFGEIVNTQEGALDCQTFTTADADGTERTRRHFHFAREGGFVYTIVISDDRKICWKIPQGKEETK